MPNSKQRDRETKTILTKFVDNPKGQELLVVMPQLYPGQRPAGATSTGGGEPLPGAEKKEAATRPRPAGATSTGDGEPLPGAEKKEAASRPRPAGVTSTGKLGQKSEFVHKCNFTNFYPGSQNSFISTKNTLMHSMLIIKSGFRTFWVDLG